MLVASRHPYLEDVHKGVLEEAGYQVLTMRYPEQLEGVCKGRSIDLVVVGYSITKAERDRIAQEMLASCDCPILELWDRHPPQPRYYPVNDYFARSPEDFLDRVDTILARRKAG